MSLESHARRTDQVQASARAQGKQDCWHAQGSFSATGTPTVTAAAQENMPCNAGSAVQEITSAQAQAESSTTCRSYHKSSPLPWDEGMDFSEPETEDDD